MVNKNKIAKKYRQFPVNFLAEAGVLAKSSSNLIDLSIGDPDFITHSSIINAAFQDVKNGATKYTEADGDPELIHSIINFYKRTYQLSFLPQQVRVTVGALHGLYLALVALLDPGDEVIVVEPYFSPYKDQILSAGGTPIFVSTSEKSDFIIDPDALAEAVTNKTKAMILNSPNNPTGAVFPKEVCQKIAALAKKHDFYILADEVYDGFCFYADFTPMASLAPEHTITFGSMSKNFAMTGWRIGYMIAPSYINIAAKMINESITYSAPTPSQRAAIYALDHSKEILPQIANTFQERLEYIGKKVHEIPFLSTCAPKGSLYAFINISETGMDSVSFAKHLLKETQILLVPGIAFGRSYNQYVRLAATQPLPILKKAFNRIEKLNFK